MVRVPMNDRVEDSLRAALAAIAVVVTVSVLLTGQAHGQVMVKRRPGVTAPSKAGTSTPIAKLPTKVNVKAPTPEELQSKLTNAQKELAKVRQAMEELLREVRNQKGKNKELMEKLVQRMQEIDALQRENVRLKQENNRLLNRIAKLLPF